MIVPHKCKWIKSNSIETLWNEEISTRKWICFWNDTGDAVNRFSRHWSNSSQDEKDKDICETLSLPNGSSGSAAAEASHPTATAPRLFRQVLGRRPKWKRQESTSLSLDCVADPLQSAAAKSNELDQITFAGRCLLNTSVWTWGQNKLGQLGLSDCVSRDQPTCVRSLSAVGICKLVVGSFHCLALTLDGRVFAWGSNSKGQVGPGNYFNNHSCC